MLYFLSIRQAWFEYSSEHNCVPSVLFYVYIGSEILGMLWYITLSMRVNGLSQTLEGQLGEKSRSCLNDWIKRLSCPVPV